MRLINLDDILKQFPKADFDGDNLENMKAYPHWKTDITGLFTILKSVPIIEACEDAISREEAINELKLAYFNKDLQSAKDDPCIVDAMTDWAIRTIKNLPSVTPQTRWIPCSERLPDTTDEVLVTDGIDMMVAWYDYTLVGWASFDSNFDTDVPIKAWMPLPQTRWIPCSERLPDTTDEVLVTNGVDMMVAWYDYTLVGWASFDSNFDTDVPIKAWMPLPQPYKAESEG